SPKSRTASAASPEIRSVPLLHGCSRSICRNSSTRPLMPFDRPLPPFELTRPPFDRQPSIFTFFLPSFVTLGPVEVPIQRRRGSDPMRFGCATLQGSERRVAVFQGKLPFPWTEFVGRERERASLSRLLLRARLVTVVGLSGVGKTRLACQVVEDLLPEFDGQV